MLLVLGRPEAGVTTFLRTLSGDHEGYSSVSGQIEYGSTSYSLLTDVQKTEICYLPEQDLHFPSLSVRDTLLLAIRARTPARLPRGQTAQEWQERQLQAITRLFNIEHTISTAVGNETHPGVSGGERKRISAAEVLATRASVVALDNVTAGLDSSTALEMIRVFKSFAVDGQRTVVAGLRQVGEAVYDTFDHVLLLDQGRQVYFGPRTKAKSYFQNLGFECLPGQTTADFLCACTDSITRRTQAGLAKGVPLGPVRLAGAFASSTAKRELDQRFTDYKSHFTHIDGTHLVQASLAERHRLSNGPFTLNYLQQVYLLSRRQFSLIRADLRVHSFLPR